MNAQLSYFSTKKKIIAPLKLRMKFQKKKNKLIKKEKRFNYNHLFAFYEKEKYYHICLLAIYLVNIATRIILSI